MSFLERCVYQAVAFCGRPRVIGATLLPVSAILLAVAALVTPDRVVNLLGEGRFTDIRIATVLGGSKYDASFDPGIITATLQDLRVVAATLGILCALLGLALLIRPARVSAFHTHLRTRFGRLNAHRADGVYCVLVSVIALILTLVATRNGPGLDPDSIEYAVAGRNLFAGKAPGDFALWTPGYPLLIAGAMHTGLAADRAAGMVSALCLALSVFPLCALGRILGGRTAGYLACLIPVVLWPVALVSVYAWSEMPYIFGSLCAVLCLTCFTTGQGHDRRLWMLGAAAVFTGMAALTRYIGVSLIAAGFLVVLMDRRYSLKRRTVEGVGFSIVTALPLGAWVIRNLLATGTLAGQRPDSGTGLIHNTQAVISQIAGDFTSGDALNTLWPAGAALTIAVVGILVAVLVVLAIKGDADHMLLNPYLRSASPSIVYVVAYLAALIGIASLWDFLPIYVRFLTPAYPFIAVLLISFGCCVGARMCTGPFRSAFLGAFVVLLLLVTALQLPSALLVRNGAQQGYSYSAPFWRDAPAVAWAEATLPEDAIVFTNDAYALQLRLPDATFRWLPADDEDSARRQDCYTQLASTPSSYALVFRPYAAPRGRQNCHQDVEQMSRQGLLVAVADFPEATAWRVTS